MPMWNQSRIRGATRSSHNPATLIKRGRDQHACQARALECARKSSSHYPITFDTAGDNFKTAHIFPRDRGDHGAVYCEAQVLGTVERSSSREPPNVELVTFNVFTAVESFPANSGVRQGVQPGEVSSVARSRSVRHRDALLRAQVRKFWRAPFR